jgi:hypothetical protein
LKLRSAAPSSSASPLNLGQLGYKRVAHAVVRELIAPPPPEQRTGPKQEETLRGFDVAPGFGVSP